MQSLQRMDKKALWFEFQQDWRQTWRSRLYHPLNKHGSGWQGSKITWLEAIPTIPAPVAQREYDSKGNGKCWIYWTDRRRKVEQLLLLPVVLNFNSQHPHQPGQWSILGTSDLATSGKPPILRPHLWNFLLEFLTEKRKCRLELREEF